MLASLLIIAAMFVFMLALPQKRKPGRIWRVWDAHTGQYHSAHDRQVAIALHGVRIREYRNARSRMDWRRYERPSRYQDIALDA